MSRSGSGVSELKHHLVYIRLMRTALGCLAALICGAAVAVATWMVGLQVAPPCPRCQGHYCSLGACVWSLGSAVFRSDLAVAGLFGLIAAALALLAVRRWKLVGAHRPRPTLS
jgi:hypothetical protein